MNKNYAVFPCRNVRITQNYNSAYSHASQPNSTNGVKSYPIDICWGDTNLMAPCQMKSGKMNGFWNESVLNQVFFHSTEKVHCANGEYDYITILAGHMDDWDYSQPQIGTVYERGIDMVNQGTDGGVAAHLDIVVAIGLQTGWVQNSFGEWVLPNSRKPEDVFYIDPKFNNVLDTCGLVFQTIPTDAYITLPNTVSRDINTDQFEVLYVDVNVRSGAGKSNPVVVFPCKQGIYNVLEIKDGWYRIKDGMWVNEIAGTYYPKYVEPPKIEEPIIEKPIENDKKDEETIDNSGESGIIDTNKKKQIWIEILEIILTIIRKIMKR